MSVLILREPGLRPAWGRGHCDRCTEVKRAVIRVHVCRLLSGAASAGRSRCASQLSWRQSGRDPIGLVHGDSRQDDGVAATVGDIVIGFVFEAVVALRVAVVVAITLTSLRDASRLAAIRRRRVSGVD